MRESCKSQCNWRLQVYFMAVCTTKGWYARGGHLGFFFHIAIHENTSAEYTPAQTHRIYLTETALNECVCALFIIASVLALFVIDFSTQLFGWHFDFVSQMFAFFQQRQQQRSNRKAIGVVLSDMKVRRGVGTVYTVHDVHVLRFVLNAIGSLVLLIQLHNCGWRKASERGWTKKNKRISLPETQLLSCVFCVRASLWMNPELRLYYLQFLCNKLIYIHERMWYDINILVHTFVFYSDRMFPTSHTRTHRFVEIVDSFYGKSTHPLVYANHTNTCKHIAR